MRVILMVEAYRFALLAAPFAPDASVASSVIAMIALAVLVQGRPAAIVAFARSLSAISILFAAWALAILPGAFFAVRDNIHRRHPFYESIAIVPVLAVFGALALLVIHKTVAVGAPLGSWREWCSARGQGFVACAIAFAQLGFVETAVCADCDAFAARFVLAALAFVIAVQAAIRLVRERLAGATSTTDSRAE